MRISASLKRALQDFVTLALLVLPGCSVVEQVPAPIVQPVIQQPEPEPQKPEAYPTDHDFTPQPARRWRL